MNILLLENISSEALCFLNKRNYLVESLNHTLSENDLISKINTDDINIIGIRSKTKITANVIQNCPNLLCVGCFCIGTDQVDLNMAAQYGIVVFNSPFSSTRSVAELTLCEIIALSRKLCVKNEEMHRNYWNKTAVEMYEIRGKTLGIIGYGHVGSQLSVLAENFGMNVIYYDIKNVMPLGNSLSVETMENVLQKSDYVSLHVPLDDTTRNMIGLKQLQMMKKGSYLLNLSRGAVVDIEALSECIREEHLAGASIDVFPNEPRGNQVEWNVGLSGLHNVILTPHIGGATVEAQDSIGLDVVNKIHRFVITGNTEDSVNIPNISVNGFSKNSIRICCIHQNKYGAMAKINEIYSKYGINIIKQYLSTKGKIGYCVTEIQQPTDQNLKSILYDIRKLDINIKTSIKYPLEFG